MNLKTAPTPTEWEEDEGEEWLIALPSTPAQMAALAAAQRREAESADAGDYAGGDGAYARSAGHLRPTAGLMWAAVRAQPASRPVIAGDLVVSAYSSGRQVIGIVESIRLADSSAVVAWERPGGRTTSERCALYSLRRVS